MALKRLATAVIEIATDSTKFDKGVESLAKGLRALNIDPTTKGLREFGRSATDAGSAMTKGLSLPIIAAAGFALKTASDFESSFAGVRKTVNATEAEFAALSSGFREMAKTIPVNVNELNKIGEAAGQLGIKTESILGFTRVMADLGVATNLSAEEAATSLARLANITQMPQAEFDRLGSTIVALGNNFATTEAEIVQMGLRIAGAGHQIGLTEDQILAVSAALSSVGIEAEAGGSAISKVMIDMASQVEKGGKKLELFSAIAGVDFKKAFQEDAANALNLFIKGLADTERTGVSTLTALEALGIEEVRMRDALLRASGAGDLMNETLRVGAEGWRENTALTKEAEQRYKTFESQAKILWQTISDTAITIGTALIPVVQSLMETLKPVIERVARLAEGFAGLPQPIQMIALGVAGLAAAIGPVLLIVGQLALGVAALLPWFAKGTVAAKIVAGAIALLTSPIGLVVAAIAAMVIVWKVWGDDIVRIVSSTISAVKTWLVDKFGPILRPVRDLLVSVGEMFSMFGKLVGAVFGLAVREIGEAVTAIGGWLREKLAPVIDPAIALFHELKTAMSIVSTAVVGFAKDIYQGVKGWLLDKFTAVVDGIRAKVDAVTGFFRGMYDAVVGHSYVPDMMKGITQSFAGLEGGMVTPTVVATGQVVQAFKEQTVAQRLVAEALGETAKQTKTKLTPAQKEAAAAAKEHKEAIESLRAELSGDRAAGDVAMLAEAFGKLTPAQLANKEIIANLLAQYAQLRAQVTDPSQLPADLETLRLKHLSITDAIDLGADGVRSWGQEVTLQTDEVTQAFERMGVQTRASLQATAAQAMADYQRIADSGMATADTLEAAWQRVEDAQAAAADRAGASWGGFFDQLKTAFLGDGPVSLSGIFDFGGRVVSQFSKGWQTAFEGASAIARAFAGDFSGVVQFLSQHFDTIVNFAKKAFSKLGELSNGWKIALTALVPPLGIIAWVMGGPDANEKAGREVAKQFRDTLASMMTEQQKLEAGNDEWKKSVIVVRDAYLAAGRTAEEALAAMDALWRAEKQGAGAVEAQMRIINGVLEEQQRLAQQASAAEAALNTASTARMEKLTTQLGALQDRRKSLADSVADEAPEAIMGVIEKRTRAQMAALDEKIKQQQNRMKAEADAAAKALEDALANLKPKTVIVPFTFVATNSLPSGGGGISVPVRPMADGGFGHVTRPTLFLAGEKPGGEDFAFSGAGKRFGDGAASAPSLDMGALASAVENGMRRAAGVGRDQVIEVKVGEEVFARHVVRHTNRGLQGGLIQVPQQALTARGR